jgi:hypothetical protein
VAAGEDQTQAIVHDGAVLGVGRMCLLIKAKELAEAVGPVSHRAVAPQPVDCAAPRGHRDPRPGPGWNAVATPGGDCIRESVLHGVLGELEVTNMTDQGGEDGSALVAERACDRAAGILVLR